MREDEVRGFRIALCRLDGAEMEFVPWPTYVYLTLVSDYHGKIYKRSEVTTYIELGVGGPVAKAHSFTLHFAHRCIREASANSPTHDAETLDMFG